MFFERITYLLKENKISRTKLTNDLNLGKNQIKYWENHGNIPNGTTLQKIADYFGVTVDYLLGKADQKEKPSDTEDLTAFEHIIIERLRTLSPEKLREAESYIDYLIDQQEKDNQ